MSDWKKTTFDISTPYGPRMTHGYVRDGIAVHRSIEGRAWNLTHLLSGAFFAHASTATKAKLIADAVLLRAPKFAKRGKFGTHKGIPQLSIVRDVVADFRDKRVRK